ncbi:MAG: CNNM domain-containing protein [Paludibacteraceae bacterium]|nr:CNNM domain-containing protein [Paludibacteraceae bacterium]
MDIPLQSSLWEMIDTPSFWGNATIALAILVALVSYVLLSFTAFFESEFFSLNSSEMAEIKISNEKKFDRLKTLSEDPLQTLGGIISTRYALIVSALMTTTLLLWHFAESFQIPVWGKWIISFLIIGLLLSIFAEYIPKKMADKQSQKHLCESANLMYWLGILFTPFTKVLMMKTGVVERRLESRTQHSAAIEDISDNLNLSGAESVDEKEILLGVMNFGKISVDEIMQPRVDIVDVDFNSDFETVLKIIRESEYSRLPVYEDSIDYVKGILYIKDFLQYMDQEKDFKWQEHIREAYFVPENKKIDDLLKEFQQKHIHMAVVVDEFGGTSGIVTMEDIIEVIVGDICDEHDEEEKQITPIDENTFLLDGKLLLSEFYHLLDGDRELFEKAAGDADTLAGLILESKGYIPTPGESFDLENYHFEIMSADKRRIKEIKFVINNEKSE